MSSESVVESTLEHLFEAAKIVGFANRTTKLLNSYYLSRIQSIANTENITLSKSSNLSCNKCFTAYNSNNAVSVSMKPPKIRRKMYKKLVTALESNENLSDSKEILAKKYLKLVYNVAETTCNLCDSKQKTNIRFIRKNKENAQTEPPQNPSIVQQLSELELVKPKKRKRDKYSGLKIKDKLTNSLFSGKLLSTKPTIHQMKLNQSKSKANNTKKSKNSNGGVRKVKSISSAEKQRKNILLLANVLKMSDQKQQNSSHMKLHTMFRK